jgi:very-short-patch-repair endonuclease
MGVKYINEHPFTYYAVDNYLIDNNLIVEVMGDYWHSNPCKYNTVDDLNNMQINRITTDKAKHSYIKNQYGIEILYLWEHDICNNPKLCKLLIDYYIANNGILNNYHSFNYSIDNDNNIIINKKLIIPYQNRKINRPAIRA